MSYTFLQVLGAESSVDSFAGMFQSAPSSWKKTVGMHCSSDNETECCHGSQSGMTCEHSTDGPGADGLTSCVEGSRAKTSARPAVAQASRANGPAFGGSLRGLLARYDRSTCSWKTPQCSLLADLDVFSETWPNWGTMRNGESWERTTPVLRTGANASGLWRSPTATEASGGGQNGLTRLSQGHHMRLRDQIKIPTQRAEDSESCGAHRGKPDTLTSWTRQFPTPSAEDNRDRGGQSTPSIARRIAKGKQVMLSMTVQGTPDSPIGSLNPDWVELLMGWPLGWTSLDPLPRANWERWLETGGAWSEGQSWATPTLCGNYNRKGASPNSGDGLETQVRQSFASPCAGDSQGSHGGGMGRSLRTDIAEWKMFQTPSCADGLGGHLTRGGRRSNELLLSGEAKQSPNPVAAWEQNTPRVAVGVKRRQARLKMIGNGQVPLCAAMAWHTLVPKHAHDALEGRA